MNYIWCVMVAASLIFAAVNGTVTETVAAIAEGAAAGVETVLSFAGIMCFWCGIMRIMEKCGAVDLVGALIRPVVKRLFPDASDEARGHIVMNLVANVLGMGNAATPAGVKAMAALDKENPRPVIASASMATLVVLNTTSFQLVPTTVMSMRAAAGGDASCVIVPIWIASATAIIVALIAVRLAYRNKEKYRRGSA